MKIHYLTGYPPINDPNGGGLANSSLISKGTELGHTIEVYSSEETASKGGTPDLYWLSSMNGCFSLPFLETLTRDWTIPFIIQDDGYQNLCPQPTREYKLCFQKEHHYTNKITLDSQDMYNETPTYTNCRDICRYDLMCVLADKCKASVSVSTMHGHIWSSIFPTILGKQVIVEPLIDVTMFHLTQETTPRRNDLLYAGTITRGKGYFNCVDYAKLVDLPLFAVGDIHHTVQGFIDPDTWYARLPYDQMPAMFATFKYFIHLPIWPEPQGRTVTEALLCGCTAICNNNVGALSYPWLDRCIHHEVPEIAPVNGNVTRVTVTDRKYYEDRIANAPRKFWTDLYNLGVVHVR